MIKKEFIENNLLKVLDYLPEEIIYGYRKYYLNISKHAPVLVTCWVIKYSNPNYKEDLIIETDFNLINCLERVINKLNKYIPNFTNDLINI